MILFLSASNLLILEQEAQDCEKNLLDVWDITEVISHSH